MEPPAPVGAVTKTGASVLGEVKKGTKVTMPKLKSALKSYIV
jgi:hypothetical protein